MSMLSEITLEMTFDAGHRIVGHKGKCARLHGHTYRVEIRCVGPLRDPGFVVDFGDLKDLVNQWDHYMLLWENDPVLLAQKANTYMPQNEYLKVDKSVVRLPFNPTAENMAQDLASRIRQEFDLMIVAVTLWETPKACAYALSETEQIPL